MKIVQANSASIPALGFGTFRMPGADVLRMLPAVLKLGYRHIDTAQIYGNEAEVGEGIVKSGVPRNEVFLTTKVWVDNYRRNAFLRSVDESLRKLKTDHVDLLLLHWPNDSVPLVTNQIEWHPYIDQTVVHDAARRTGMSLTAYYAMADGNVFDDAVLKSIAARHGKDVAQVVLRWLIQHDGVITLSKTVSEERAASNAAIFDFELSEPEMAAIRALARKDGRIVSPPGLAPVWD